MALDSRLSMIGFYLVLISFIWRSEADSSGCKFLLRMVNECCCATASHGFSDRIAKTSSAEV